jgi:hypothetical protein
VNYAAALVVTIVVETVVYGVGLPRLGRVSARAAAAASVLVNLVSHSWAWLLAWPLFEDVLGPVAGFVLLEAVVCGAEWRVLRAWRYFDSAMLAAVVVLANGMSLAAGALLPA